MADEEPAESDKRRPLVMAMAGAIGLAVLGFGGQVAYDFYKDWRNPPSAQRAAQLQEKFNALGDLPRRAGVYVDTGQEGTPADVRELSRHFHVLVDAFAGQEVTAQDLRRKYGGTLSDWRIRYSHLATTTIGDFSESDRIDFGRLSEALGQIGGPPLTEDEAWRLDPANDAGLSGNVSEHNFASSEEPDKAPR